MTGLDLGDEFPHSVTLKLCTLHGDAAEHLADNVAALAPSSLVYLTSKARGQTVCQACRKPVNGTHWHIEARW